MKYIIQCGHIIKVGENLITPVVKILIEECLRNSLTILRLKKPYNTRRIELIKKALRRIENFRIFKDQNGNLLIYSHLITVPIRKLIAGCLIENIGCLDLAYPLNKQKAKLIINTLDVIGFPKASKKQEKRLIPKIKKEWNFLQKKKNITNALCVAN